MAPKLALFVALSLLFAATTSAHVHGEKCPMNALKLSVCANVLNGAVKVGLPEHEHCCPLLGRLVDLDAAVCLCTAIKANVLGIKLNLPVDLKLILNKCGKYCPDDFTCPY
ncbi:hypothetical protein PR202_gb09190 [Eleusine coracana subsp. coracana]|uniref:Bifunctional inhibitor/plant lipid transfer protein/seed storage helical domain-containing protein n=1 Tax=Eleusine coracana subsp. coracana TaxID=191504 RepID=A0AAV5EGM9_ELECO|nr:hypothetical protein QOZ80_2BG0194520 [Eleusine coracana subsp. coracana]GJN21687.1 hypothetical protein PR202_gb09190 [Eleusine coracana subsp. coracana]